MDPPWQVKKPLIATLDSIAMLSAGAFPSQPHWCRRPSPHECPPPGFLGNASFTLMSTLAHRKPLSIRQPAARQTHESRSVFSPVLFSSSLSSLVFLFSFFVCVFFLLSPVVSRFAETSTRYCGVQRKNVTPGDFETADSLNNRKTRAGSQCVARWKSEIAANVAITSRNIDFLKIYIMEKVSVSKKKKRFRNGTCKETIHERTKLKFTNGRESWSVSRLFL